MNIINIGSYKYRLSPYHLKRYYGYLESVHGAALTRRSFDTAREAKTYAARMLVRYQRLIAWDRANREISGAAQ